MLQRSVFGALRSTNGVLEKRCAAAALATSAFHSSPCLFAPKKKPAPSPKPKKAAPKPAAKPPKAKATKKGKNVEASPAKVEPAQVVAEPSPSGKVPASSEAKNDAKTREATNVAVKDPTPPVVRTTMLLPPPALSSSRAEQAHLLQKAMKLSKYQQLPLGSTRFRRTTARQVVVDTLSKRVGDGTDVLRTRGVVKPLIRFRQRIPPPTHRVSVKLLRFQRRIPPCTHPNVGQVKKKQVRKKRQVRTGLSAKFTSQPQAVMSPMGAYMKATRATVQKEAAGIGHAKGLTGAALNQFTFEQTNAIIGARWRALTPAQKAAYGHTA